MLVAPTVAAQYPAKPIRVIVPFAPGGPSDLLARAVGQKLAESWGQQVIIDNRPGANGIVGGATPRAIVERLNTEVVRILRLPDVAQRLQAEAFEIPAETPDQFAAVIRAEIAKWAPIVKESGIRPE